MAYFLLLPFLNILYFCFILFIAFLFHFVRDADLRKSANCARSVFPFIKERKKKKFIAAVSSTKVVLQF